jgi:hypothetical protein
MNNKVFVSYSHSDSKYLNELKRHLNPIASKIGYWDDTYIKAGQEWDKEISQAINAAKISIMLISADFFNSKFIQSKEFPILLRKANEKGATILFVYLKPCLIEDYPELCQYQSIHDLKYPVATLDELERDNIWMLLAKRIKELIIESETTIEEKQTSGSKKIEQIMKKYLGKTKLQYISYLSKDRVLFDCNCFDLMAEELDDIFQEKPIERANLYRNFSLEFAKKVLVFADEFKNFDNKIEQGDLIRLVYDVSQGAAFFGQILQGTRDNLVGITIYQDEVDKCVIDFGQMIDEIRILRGLPALINHNTK